MKISYNIWIIGNTETCSEVTGTNDFECACESGQHGPDCNDPLPCAANDGDATSVCNNGPGTNTDVGDPTEYCECGDCSQQPDNLDVNSPTNIWGGDYCDEDICTRAPPASCINGTPTNDHSGTPNTDSAVCTCVCQVNWSGADCNTDDCASTTCLNGGSLDRSVQGQCSCTCLEGFTGAQCETPLETPTGTGCWKCDAMTYVQCATEGSFQTCSEDQSNGDNGVCFVEYREQNQQLTQLCTGCKDAKDSLNLKN